jgi:integrase
LYSSGEGRVRQNEVKMQTLKQLPAVLFVAIMCGRHVLIEDLYFGTLKAGEGKPFYFTVNQVKAILKAFAGRKPWDLFFTLLALSGLGASEILGLRAEDLDFETGTIHIRQAAWHGQIQTVKTRESENTIPMTPLVREKLTAHLKDHKHELLFVNDRNRFYNAFRHALARMLLLQTTGAAVAHRQLTHADASQRSHLWERFGRRPA